MKINNFEECIKVYGTDGVLDERDSQDRLKNLKDYPFALVIEGNYLEHDMAAQWLKNNIGLQDEEWQELWYGKIAYDYGFWEFFFKNQKTLDSFKNAVPTFYAETVTGKWRTDGYENHIDIKDEDR